MLRTNDIMYKKLKIIMTIPTITERIADIAPNFSTFIFLHFIFLLQTQSLQLLSIQSAVLFQTQAGLH